MRLTVVLTAFRRTRYLPHAIGSLARQEPPSGECEVLAYTDPQIDPRAFPPIPYASVSARSAPHPNLGQTQATAIRESEGDVIAFLDDDDLFEPGKLRAVEEAFSSDGRLGYFHNSFRPVDEAGNPLRDHPFRRSSREARARRGAVVVDSKAIWRVLRKLPNLAPDFNNSCIAIRREVVEPYLDTLAKIPLSTEAFHFFAAATGPWRLRIDPRPLTGYRIHGGNASVLGDGQRPDSPSPLVQFTERALEGYRVVADWVTERGVPEATREARAIVRVQELYRILRSPVVQRGTMVRALLEALSLQDTYTWHVEKGIAPPAFLYPLLPVVAQRFYRAGKRRTLSRE